MLEAIIPAENRFVGRTNFHKKNPPRVWLGGGLCMSFYRQLMGQPTVGFHSVPGVLRLLPRLDVQFQTYGGLWAGASARSYFYLCPQLFLVKKDALHPLVREMAKKNAANSVRRRAGSISALGLANAPPSMPVACGDRAYYDRRVRGMSICPKILHDIYSFALLGNKAIPLTESSPFPHPRFTNARIDRYINDIDTSTQLKAIG
jgi:hypothetical protein